MNISDCYDLHKIIESLEVALQIDGVDMDERDIDQVIKNVRQRISRQYGIDIVTYKVTSPEVEMSDFRMSVKVFVDNIANIHAKLAGYAQMERYHAASGVSLSNINYLGKTEESLINNLAAMSREYYLPKTEKSIQAIKDKLGTINNCWEKRLFVLAVIAHEIGFDELTACIAEILLQGTIRNGASRNGYQGNR